MRTKNILALLLLSMNMNSCASYSGSLCNFNWFLENPSNRGEEFAMLLEPADHPNHKMMADVLVGILITLGKKPTKITPACSSATYIKQLLEFYRKPVNKKELENKHPNMAIFIDALQLTVQERNKEFFEEEIVIDF